MRAIRRIGFPDAFRGVESVDVFYPPDQPVPDVFAPRGRWKSGPMHTFCDDYRQEFFWRRPEEGLIVALAAGVITAPDFTVYDNDPPQWAAYQAWRSATVARFWQAHGVTVLPVVTFAGTPWQYVPRGSVWAVRGPSLSLDLDRWCDQIRSWADNASPAGLVVFGREIPSSVVRCPVHQRRLVSSK